MSNKLAAIIVLDGWGLGEDYKGNATKIANTPNFDLLMEKYPNTTLTASGEEVGLPSGQMGNSEVGHLNIGAGRIIYQEFTRINKSIRDGSFYEKEEFNQAIDKAKANNKKLHLLGLFSHGGVHSHSSHVYALLELAKKKDFNEVYIHCFLDGRDVPPKSAINDIEELEEKIAEIGVGKIATISGRYYAMDRDKRWERTEKAYNAMLLGEGLEASSGKEAIENSYNDNVTDEFIVPTVIKKNGNPIATIDENDSIIFYNFRPDRARQITRAIVDESFEGFNRSKKVDTEYVTMTQYDKTINNVKVTFKPQSYKNTLGEYISSKGMRQLRIAETEKYAHVTFFFNGGVETPNPGEDRVLIPSPKVATYDLQPEMSIYEVKDEVIGRLKKEDYNLLVLNFANPDMVGHTGDIEATVKALEAVDECLGEVVDEIIRQDGRILITADHGNSEEMRDTDTGAKLTAHTTNKVPCITVGAGNVKLREGILADISPTILDMIGEDIPQEMTGKSIILK
ncbi:2,3-bisphosphoglycerate-independent phosphoglycerate mutase [Clostridium sp. D2Q-11]|uniref:2,3-bisphosphoglycerate-independent phosphoglycerate mutase n=1 Tax=Anaeromonas frigoriresistens TaxID=2683708 RepID=A0A942V0E7_9FIRM|nr:2,3-bisphosphoglycerate-independent phosphoglycerate mutase [Anaeromonas frigoriresistens]MBS4537767.1 2,3-bisphosphoglycerate-independent phosphoglycerate mutase [Anaeromonas frigoriresistens]